ncbi:hypothetical protein [Chitinophaga arvensicola]|uniref:Uncharacterized protein n=1 Tax=Chitinophaga arvensicola TaxID=29529 RepID=A0A1I0RU15_9BACT|nr:hypothetical protein [Chitinophaga arvensicola]SEW44773.1 hypothetical protein SAMN04488122_3374 [Chitinophaga arvensicola]
MEPHQYFTREGNVYVKKNQILLYCLLALLLFGLMAFIFTKNLNAGAKGAAVLFGLLGVILILRMTGKFRIDVDRRVLSNQPVFFVSPTEYSFDDFQHFTISRQTFLITLNASATMVMLKKGKEKHLLVHQSIFLTKPLQRVTEEIAGIMGLPE